jgi:hypothetical protein
MHDLAAALFEAGLIQFGWFENDQRPFRLEFDFLPAYPQLLRTLADHIRLLLDVQLPERIVASPEALPLGVALSLDTDLPLVYSRSGGGGFDLIGAYNTGSTAVLLTTAVSSETERLLSKCREVGLRMQSGIALIEVTKRAKSEPFPVHALLSLEEVVQSLRSEGYLPPGQAMAVLEWLRATPHPDEAAP